MNLPIAWVVGGAIPAAQTAKQVANIAATSASHFFGELLQTNPAQTNPAQANPTPANPTPANPSAAVSGRSGPNEPKQNRKASSESKSWSERVESIRNYLSKFVSDTRARYGQKNGAEKLDAVAISADGKGQPLLSGPEPIRTELEQFLRSNPDITKEINELASLSSESGPLRLLPKTDTGSRGSESWKLWLDG